MKLTLHRVKENPTATLGSLFVDGVLECVTLEDVVRDIGPNGEGKIHGATAIPAGIYPVIINLSPRFQRKMMRLVGVPHFDGILIHSLNDSTQTDGCIGVGTVVDGPDHIHGGSVELGKLQEKVQAALDAGDEVTIEITNDFKGV